MKFVQFARKSAISLALFAIYNIAQATEYVDAQENTAKVVEVSKKDLTRISVEGGSIVNAKYMDGELDVQTENSNGQLYFKPLVSKPISIFITSDNGRNYLLTLRPNAKKSADSIVIREKTTLQGDQISQMRQVQLEEERLARNSATYETRVQEFVAEMAVRRDNSEISCAPAGEEVPLWQEALLIRKERCSTSNLQGQVFTLSNVSNRPMVLAEQEFYKKNVIAVAIRQLELQPNEQTEIYIVFGDK